MNRVDHQMGVKMLPIHMGGHQDLTAGEESLRQFQTDLMGLGGSEVFFRGEGLGVLVEEGAGVFPVEVFGGHEALHGHICHTVDARQWNDRWFNSIRAWKVERVSTGAPMASGSPVPPPAPSAMPEFTPGDAKDDLPF